MIKSAEISDCEKFRFSLSRTWDSKLKVVHFMMVNPSTADANDDDATIRKCIGFAKKWGYGSIIVTNLFAFRSTDVKGLNQGFDVFGGFENYYALIKAVEKSEITVLAWGNKSKIPKSLRLEVDEVIEFLETWNRKGFCLGKTKSGCPKHPLMLSYDTDLIEF